MTRVLLPFDAEVATSQCDELDGWQRSFAWKGEGRAWSGRLRRDAETEAVAASTRMEGVPVTVEEVRHILAGRRPSQVTPADAALVEGYRDAIRFSKARADAEGFRWNGELIVGLHDRVLAGRVEAGAGRFASGARYVATEFGPVFEPPLARDIHRLVDDACLRLNAGNAHPAVAAAWAHVAIAAIHPFRDGNGRCARVLASLAMYRGGFRLWPFTSLESWWGRHTGDYYASFACLGPRFDPHANVTPFIAAHIGAQLTQVRAFDLRERIEHRIWDALTDAVSAAGLEDRLVNALWEAFFDRDVTAGYYRSVADVSPATATHDLRALTASGMLNAEGNRRGRRYTAGERLYPAVAERLDIPRDGVDRGRIIAELSRRVAGRSGSAVGRRVTTRALHLGRDSALDYEVVVEDIGAKPIAVRASLSPEAWLPLGRELGISAWGMPSTTDPLTGVPEQVALAFVDVIVDEIARADVPPGEIKIASTDTDLVARIVEQARERLSALRR